VYIKNILVLKKVWIEVKDHNMETIKEIVNHPLSKAVVCGVIGGLILAHGHSMMGGMAFGIGIREFLLALKK